MPDLVTHLASALLPGVALRADRAVLLALGACLPDLGGRLPGLSLAGLRWLGLPTFGLEKLPFGVLHQPVGSGLLALLVASMLPERDRALGLLLVLSGVMTHIGLDVLQDHRGHGHALLFPFSNRRFELGLFGPEATVPWVPAIVLVTAGLWGVRWWRARRRQRSR
ncbi:MAG: hypothetical protein EA397_05530 [Deltaproteobacteria bacterium]|nr:MAG: hypothetical protein EA397_05530 [Deltaproteobacteria bacterium]